MARHLVSDVYVDGVRYEQGSTDTDLAKVSTDVEQPDGKVKKVPVADRIGDHAWITDAEAKAQAEPAPPAA